MMSIRFSKPNTARGLSHLFLIAIVSTITIAPALADPAKGPDPNPDPYKPVPRPDAIGFWLSPKAFRAASAKVMPSVVTIETYGGVLAPGGPKPKTPGRRPRGRGMQGISRPGEGPTTGLIVSEEGHILTSTFNFIRKPKIITVVLNDGAQHVAEMLGKDGTRGLALLKIKVPNDEKLPVPNYADSSKLRIGQWAISLGVGHGAADPAMSTGIVSAKNRIFGKAVQTDANISPANYGGPLLDIEGNVIGICVPLSPRGSGAGAGVEWYNSGIGFAIPMDRLDRIIAQMKQGKSIEPGRMGIQPKAGGKAGAGIIVAKIIPKSPAATAGMKANDVVTHINGEKIHDMMHLRQLMGRHIAGDVLKVKFKRGDKEMEVEMKLTSGKADVAAPKLPEVPGGVDLDKLPKRKDPMEDPDADENSENKASEPDEPDPAGTTPQP